MHQQKNEFYICNKCNKNNHIWLNCPCLSHSIEQIDKKNQKITATLMHVTEDMIFNNSSDFYTDTDTPTHTPTDTDTYTSISNKLDMINAKLELLCVMTISDSMKKALKSIMSEISEIKYLSINK